MYDGATLCRRGDVVVVTLNHRLSLFGYLYLPGFPDSGNAGMLDLVLALRWVRDNIAAFGGDPGCVTLLGQSGGGAKIATLMAMPAAAGLFHRAATMSGQQLTASGPQHAAARTRMLLDKLGVPVERASRRSPNFRRRNCCARIAGTVDPYIGRGSLYMGPVLDERTLTRHPFYPDAPPQSAGIPMMIGNTHDETRSLIGRGDPGVFDITWEALPQRLEAEMRVDISGALVVAEYRKWYPQYSPADVFFAATTAGRSWRGAIVEAELRAAQGSPAFAYQLDWGSPQDGGKWGAFHTLDIPLMFGTLTARESPTGDAEEARRVSATMQQALLAFARTGDPNYPGCRAGSPTRCRGAPPWCSTSRAGSPTIRAGSSASCSPRCPSSRPGHSAQGFPARRQPSAGPEPGRRPELRVASQQRRPFTRTILPLAEIDDMTCNVPSNH